MFVLNWINMRDAYTGRVLWEEKEWKGRRDEEMVARVPESLLKCKAVSRELNFSSSKQMEDFRLEQRVLLHDQPFEHWSFTFGFVVPGSTNTWQQVIEAADDVLPPSVLDGNVVIETTFFDGNELIATFRIRLYYV